MVNGHFNAKLKEKVLLCLIFCIDSEDLNETEENRSNYNEETDPTILLQNQSNSGSYPSKRKEKKSWKFNI